MVEEVTLPFSPGDIIVPNNICGYFSMEEKPTILLLVTECFINKYEQNSCRFHCFSLGGSNISTDASYKGWRCEEFEKVGHVSADNVPSIMADKTMWKTKYEELHSSELKLAQAKLKSEQANNEFHKTYLDIALAENRSLIGLKKKMKKYKIGLVIILFALVIVQIWQYYKLRDIKEITSEVTKILFRNMYEVDSRLISLENEGYGYIGKISDSYGWPEPMIGSTTESINIISNPSFTSIVFPVINVNSFAITKLTFMFNYIADSIKVDTLTNGHFKYATLGNGTGFYEYTGYIGPGRSERITIRLPCIINMAKIENYGLKYKASISGVRF